MEIGCGFGYLTDAINNIGMPCLGIDASPTAIQKAKNLFPASEFVCANADDFDLFKKFDAQIFIFAEITWYILDDIQAILQKLRDHGRSVQKDIYIIHALTVYPEGVQQYGRDKFTNFEELKSFLNLNYIEMAEFQTNNGGQTSTCTLLFAKL